MIAAGATSPAAFCPDALAHFTRIADKRGRADDGCLQNRGHRGGEIFMADSERFADRMLSPCLVRMSEVAAIAATRLIGRGDGKFGLTAQGSAASRRRALAHAAQSCAMAHAAQ